MDPQTLIHRYLLDDLSVNEVQELNELLAKDPELRREFVLAAAADTGLREIAFERAVAPSDSPVVTRSPKRQFWVALITVAAALVVLVAFVARSSQPKFVAKLTSSEDAAWESSLPTTPGSKLERGSLRLRAGVATIQFDSGAVVVLEAPAELELITLMRAKLLSGAAVINVPEQAIGFVVETPDAYAVDYGTQFAVRVDQQHKQSDFEVIEGEIAVHHPASGDQVRLTGEDKAASASNQSLAIVSLEQQDAAVATSPQVIRIATNGRTGSAMRRDHKRHKYIQREFLSVKHTQSGGWDHRFFFSFDLSRIDLNQVASVRLSLNLVPSTRGLRSRLPKVNRFGIYGLTNQQKAAWPDDCLWDESPGPEDGVLLGTFEIPRSQDRGSFGIRNSQLLEFLSNQRGQQVTLILVRETTQIEGIGPGMTHLFASDSHPESVGPMLELTLVE